jgi:hypothetical protein
LHILALSTCYALCTLLSPLPNFVNCKMSGFVFTHVLCLCWAVLTLTPAHLQNLTHGIFYSTKVSLGAMLSFVTFAPGLVKMLPYATLPTITMFRRLPTAHRGL